MPSNAFSVHLVALLQDPTELYNAHGMVVMHGPRYRGRLLALNRAAVVASVSAWESFVEELVREAVQALRLPVGSPQGAWPALAAYANGQAGGFNTPSAANVERFVRSCLGLANVPQAWAWYNCTPAQAAQRFAGALNVRHEIAHGVNPRPIVHNIYSAPLPSFFERLARCTDAAVRQHLVAALGAANPWPA